MSATHFKVEQRAAQSAARAGILSTPHGVIRTPAFAPVGTKASVKGILPEQLKTLGAEVVLANTYHLYLQPGEEIVREAGGLARFMGWAGPTITDSGGFLFVFLVEHDDDGLWLRGSYGNPGNFWRGNFRWVFVRSRKSILLSDSLSFDLRLSALEATVKKLTDIIKIIY